MAWSGKKILDSCETDLKENILEAAESISIEKRGGPVYANTSMRMKVYEGALNGYLDRYQVSSGIVEFRALRCAQRHPNAT